MEHVVFYQSAAGVPAFRRVGSLEEAVSFAEHLRNVEDVADFTVFALTPVQLSTRPYYRIEVNDVPAAPAAPPAATEAPTILAAVPQPSAPVEPESAAEPVADPYPLPASAVSPEVPSFAPPAAPPPATFGGAPFGSAPMPQSVPEVAMAEETAALTEPPGIDAPAIDPNVVDPTVEEVVPSSPGRRSMGFFARS
jgi:hypothetical protein